MEKIENLQEALNLFEKATTKHAEATEQGDFSTGNKSYEKISITISFLKNSGSIESLVKFLDSRSIGTRMWAATYLLPTHTKESVKVLKLIAEGSDIHSLSAETTLDEWDSGSLKL